MKTLGKLQINPDKIMKNDELMTLKGGYDDSCLCFCLPPGYVIPIDHRDCSHYCYDEFGGVGWCIT